MACGKAPKTEDYCIRMDLLIIAVAQHLSKFQRIHLPTCNRRCYPSLGPPASTETTWLCRNNRCNTTLNNLHQDFISFRTSHLFLMKQLDYTWTDTNNETHKSCKSLICSRNTNIWIDLDKHILGCMNEHLGFINTIHSNTWRCPALFSGLSRRASKLYSHTKSNETNLMTDIRSGIPRILIHFLQERRMVIRIEKRESLILSPRLLRTHFLRFDSL